MRKIDYCRIGERFGKLEIVGERYKDKNKKDKVRCKCDCGVEKDFFFRALIEGSTSSCGCSQNPILHGEIHTELYGKWVRMRFRSKHSKKVKQLRPISIYKEWDSFLKFKEFAMQNGYKDGLQIFRYPDLDGDFIPDNVVFINSKSAKRLINIGNKIITAKELAGIIGCKTTTAYERMNKNKDCVFAKKYERCK